MCEGSDVSSLHWNNQAYSAVAVAGGSIGGVVFCPSLTNFFHYVSAATSYNAVTWTAVNHAKEASLAAMVGSYRVTSLGIRVSCTSELQDRNGRIYIGRLPPASSATVPWTDAYDFIGFSDEIASFDIAELPQGLSVFWIPLSTQGTVNYTTHGGSAVENYTGLGYKSPSEDVMDNRIICMWYGSNTYPMELNFESVLNIEFIPHIEDEYLFAPKAVVGDDSAVARAFSGTIQKLADKGLGDIISTGVTHALHVASNVLGTVFGDTASLGADSQIYSAYTPKGLSMLGSSRTLHLRVKSGSREAAERKKNMIAPDSQLRVNPMSRRRGSVVLDEDHWETESQPSSKLSDRGPEQNARARRS
jgi:hypothetical protein